MTVRRCGTGLEVGQCCILRTDRTFGGGNEVDVSQGGSGGIRRINLDHPFVSRTIVQMTAAEKTTMPIAMTATIHGSGPLPKLQKFSKSISSSITGFYPSGPEAQANI